MGGLATMREDTMTTHQETRQRIKGSQTGTVSSIANELANIPNEPFLPVEVKLVGWSIGVGAILLVLLVWVSHTFFAG
jgi:hypothetical protein